MIDRIEEAARLELPACDECGAWQGDPCRAVGAKLRGATRAPHKSRLEAKR